MNKLLKLSKRLNKCGYETEIFKSGGQVKEKLLKLIKNRSVGYGSSKTLKDIDILDDLKNYTDTIYTHIAGRAELEERNALTADYYLTSANAVSMDGHIVNIDGTGNRVAATCFGPKKVIYIIGKNKITDTLDDALQRAKNTAVILAKQFNRNTPCVQTGKCEECLSPECICAITTIHRRKPYGVNISIFLINKDLGI